MMKEAPKVSSKPACVKASDEAWNRTLDRLVSEYEVLAGVKLPKAKKQIKS